MHTGGVLYDGDGEVPAVGLSTYRGLGDAALHTGLGDALQGCILVVLVCKSESDRARCARSESESESQSDRVCGAVRKQFFRADIFREFRI